MVIKLKEGCLVNLNDIKVAQAVESFGGSWNIEISYYDDKKNPKAYIYCKSEEEANQLVEKLLNEITQATTVQARSFRR